MNKNCVRAVIIALALGVIPALRGHEDLFKDKNLKPTMTKSWRKRTMGALSFGAITPAALLPSWLTYRYMTPKGHPRSDIIVKAILFPFILLSNTIPATVLGVLRSYILGKDYFKEANEIDETNARMAKIKQDNK